MPTRMLTLVRCDTCAGRYPRKEMSVFHAICSECFERTYCLCTDCGTLLRTRAAPFGCDAVYHEDPGHVAPFCYSCYRQRHGGDNCWDPTPLNTSIATYKRIHSKRKYAVEIETSSCRTFEELNGKTNFGCKTDCSISGKEFISPVLYGDEGLTEIEEFLAYAAGKRWGADRECGCHTHYDMRDDSDEELYRIAYAYTKTYHFWKGCVNVERRHNSFCHEPSYTIHDIRRGVELKTNFKDFSYSFDRYDYVNVLAYNNHGTFEVRLLEGTVDAEVICNWIMVHVRFMDYVKQLTINELESLLTGGNSQVLSALVVIVNEAGLSDWLDNRIRTFLG